ncbi:SDR family oxidoreductase [Paenibacillus senegalensis]|uniref:SDR family oxidoreductase n=1 Tax=Paenibacillus senegalensis TaxID=1465766 RepID=UPI0004752F5F|nr:SDR family oxidoreductase [Paenibacillus senegalensis]
MEGKRALVTGANSGMGLATSVALARMGAEVVMVCRSESRGKEALLRAKQESESERLSLMLCDLGSLDSIRRFAELFNQQYDSLDVLVNNAGVITLKRQETADGFEQMLGVNHLGHFLLTGLLLDKLKAAPNARIVNVSSGAHKAGRIDWNDPHLKNGFNVMKGYGQSKLANIWFTIELAERIKGTGMTANCLHPGAVGTQIGVDRSTGFGKTILKLLSYVFLTPEQGAETAIYLASSPEVAEISGKYFYKKKVTDTSILAGDREQAKKLWEWSEEQVQFQWE